MREDAGERVVEREIRAAADQGSGHGGGRPRGSRSELGAGVNIFHGRQTLEHGNFDIDVLRPHSAQRSRRLTRRICSLGASYLVGGGEEATLPVSDRFVSRDLLRPRGCV